MSRLLRSITLIMAALVMMSGCAGAGSAQRVGKEPPPPKAPPPVPPKKAEPLNQTVLDAAKHEIRAGFDSNNEGIRANAIEAAQDTVGADAQDVIEMGLGDSSPIVRFASAMAAGKLQLKDLHDKLWTLAQDHDVKVQMGARYALHRLGDMRLSHDFEKYARDPNPRVREDTAFILGLLGEKSAIKILQHMTNDDDTDVRIAVAEAMWRLGDERGLKVLVAGTVSNFADDRMLCILALVGPKDRRVAEHIRGKLTDDWTEVALVAARAMGELGYDDGYGVAMNSIKSPDPRQRLLAATALGAIGRSDAQNALAPLLKDADQRVRLAAATALLKLKE